MLHKCTEICWNDFKIKRPKFHVNNSKLCDIFPAYYYFSSVIEREFFWLKLQLYGLVPQGCS